MFENIIKFFTPKHRHTDTSAIVFSTGIFYFFNRRWPLIGNDAITCYLHACPECGEILEAGKHAKLMGEKFGNYYALRASLRLAKDIFKTKAEYLLARVERREHSIQLRGYDFYFYIKDKKQVKQKPQPKSIDLAA